jgi:DDE domain
VHLKIHGRRHWLWRAVDQDGIVLDVPVQDRRHQEAAEVFLRRLIEGQGYQPRVRRVRRRLSSPPRALKRPGVRLDNLAIVPASLLPHEVSYQKYANTLPRGQVLLIVPKNAEPARRATPAKVAASLEQKGQRVRTLPQERFRAAASRPRDV